MDPEIITAPLPEGVLGATNGHTIWLAEDLLDVERDLVLEHELRHLAAGHGTHCLTVIEDAIDRDIACSRVPVTALGDAAAWSEHLWVIADELAVLPETVEQRLHVLTAAKRAALEARVADAHWAG